MKTIDLVADLLNAEPKGFFAAQYDYSDGEGIQWRYKPKDYKTMLGFLVAVSESIMNEYVEGNGCTVHEDMRTTLERTIELNDKQPNHELINKSVEQLREIYAKAAVMPDESEAEPDVDPETEMQWPDVVHALRCCSEINCVECPMLQSNAAESPDSRCAQMLMEMAAEMMDEII
ncbi:MAG: hypothetical protein IJI57_04855 [Flexilinea sp.]|nr:hypothetical protein [Flexilinea sp.]